MSTSAQWPTPALEREARALWDRYGVERDPQARAQLIEHYLPLARQAAARLFRQRADDSVPFADYLQYARTGLVEAIDHYDPGREASFSTYSAYRIRGAVLDGIRRETERAAQRTFWQTRDQERVDSLRPPPSRNSDEEIEALAGMAVGLALGFLLDHVPEELPDPAVQSNPYAAAELAQLRGLVRNAVERLPERERDIIRRHYFAQCEFRSIAQHLGVTPGRVSQLHSQALAHVRALLRAPPDFDRSV
jgi:RNA polymerase sigma factor for flagellar operon FliA